jgi:hypothetical protein
MLKPKCDHSDTRLSCQDCSGPVCPKCMVQCAVGFRCPACAAKFTSHAVKVTPWLLARTAAAALVIGYIFGVTSPGGMGWMGWILCYVVGIVVGKGLHWVARYKLGTKITTTVAVALVVGFLARALPHFLIYLGQPVGGEEISALSQEFMMQVLSVGIFTFGCLSPFLRRA